MVQKKLEGKGEVDYDYENDILFFKLKGRKYDNSIELLDNLVVDVDKEGFLVGIQMFDASEYLNIDKKSLLKIPNWQFTINVHENIIEIRLVFQVKIRNKIVEKNPIISQQMSHKLPDSQLVCEAVV